MSQHVNSISGYTAHVNKQALISTGYECGTRVKGTERERSSSTMCHSTLLLACPSCSVIYAFCLATFIWASKEGTVSPTYELHKHTDTETNILGHSYSYSYSHSHPAATYKLPQPPWFILGYQCSAATALKADILLICHSFGRFILH